VQPVDYASSPAVRETPPSANAADGGRPMRVMHPELEAVVGAILSSIVRAQAQADHTSLGVAHVYRDLPELAHFPIARAQIGLVDLNLNVAFLGDERTLTPHGRSRLSSLFVRETLELLDRPPLDALVQLRPSLAASWYRALPKVMDAIADRIDRIGAEDPETIADALLLILTRALCARMVEDSGNVMAWKTQLPEILDQILAAHLPRLTDAVRGIVRDEASVRHPLRVVYAAPELADIPPQAINTLHLRIDPQNRRILMVNGQMRVAPE
jgi:hypothetical protein